jgi:hypothetical protein
MIVPVRPRKARNASRAVTTPIGSYIRCESRTEEASTSKGHLGV